MIVTDTCCCNQDHAKGGYYVGSTKKHTLRGFRQPSPGKGGSGECGHPGGGDRFGPGNEFEEMGRCKQNHGAVDNPCTMSWMMPSFLWEFVKQPRQVHLGSGAFAGFVIGFVIGYGRKCRLVKNAGC